MSRTKYALFAGWRPLAAFAVGCTLLSPLPFAPSQSITQQSFAASRGVARVVEIDEGAALSAHQVLQGATLAQEGRYLIATGTGLAFHRTTQPVTALRTMQIPNSTIELYTWEESEASGARTAFYAYGKDGLAMLGRVRDTTYVVRLQDAEFDPLKDGAPRVSNFLAAEPAGNLHLVQFHGTPLPAFRQAILDAGGKVLRFLSDHTFLVEMNTASRDQVAQLAYVRWIGPYHPQYRLERALRESLQGTALRLPDQRYSIMLGEGGAARQAEVVAEVRRLGGKLELVEPGGMRIEATLTPEQLTQVARADAVQFIDRWGGPGEADMDIVRQVGGATAIETLKGWNGQGVRGEVFDTELNITHREWPTAPIIHSSKTTGSGGYHGTSCYGINFAKGVDAAAKGMLPGGQGIFFLYNESTQFGGTKSRYDINKELTDPAGMYRAVYQTSSVGSSLVTTYTTISAEVDDYLFKVPLLSTQSQSNAGSQSSRPQAWAKNIVSIGAFYHGNTAVRTDDKWNRSGSIGPATDGRIKPDLAYFFDQIHAPTGTANDKYTEYCGQA